MSYSVSVYHVDIYHPPHRMVEIGMNINSHQRRILTVQVFSLSVQTHEELCGMVFLQK